MRILKLAFLVILVFWGGSLAGPFAVAETSAVLRGTVSLANDEPLHGIVVTAKAVGKTYATSVFTDDQGFYYFPPMEPGHYRVWAQAAGFKRSDASLQLDDSGHIWQNFTLSEFEKIGRQLTGSEWVANLPEDTREDHRMKLIFRSLCSGCHTPSFVLQNRFDEDGWRKIITMMAKTNVFGDPPRPDSAEIPLLMQYRDELAAYLAKVRGPGPMPMDLKPFPRPRGEAAQVVITEYDVTSGLTGENVVFDGSDWSEGIPSKYEARGPHDAEPDPYGYVWIADSQVDPLRTISRLDPRTGEVRDYRLPGRHGMAMRSHGVVVDKHGNAWLNADGGLVGVEPQTDTVTYYKPPPGVGNVGGTLDADNNGMIWATSAVGAVRFDPVTETFTDYRSKDYGRYGRTYGVSVDSLGNGWWLQMAVDNLGIGDGKTGEVRELALERVTRWDELLTEKDRKLFREIDADWNTATLWSQGPRRMSAERNGDHVWVANWWGNNLAKINIHTYETGYYYYPDQSAFPGIYDTVVDKHGMVWMNMMNADTVARFNPETEEWTEFRLPSLGAETRFIAVDNNKDPVEVWVPSYRINKMTRIQFRTTATPVAGGGR